MFNLIKRKPSKQPLIQIENSFNGRFILSKVRDVNELDLAITPVHITGYPEKTTVTVNLNIPQNIKASLRSTLSDFNNSQSFSVPTAEFSMDMAVEHANILLDNTILLNNKITNVHNTSLLSIDNSNNNAIEKLLPPPVYDRAYALKKANKAQHVNRNLALSYLSILKEKEQTILFRLFPFKSKHNKEMAEAVSDVSNAEYELDRLRAEFVNLVFPHIIDYSKLNNIGLNAITDVRIERDKLIN